jgi:transcriptional regulator with XRE-family HTH domain|tara:strand:+ start:261 stop:488 length:228 start_codon:yes stop_codon:yes gene_type:complete
MATKFGTMLLTERRKLKMTQDELAEKTGATRASISFWERGDRVPGLGFFATIAKMFEWTDEQIREVLDELSEDES